jgi:hypothetical protein
MRTTLGPRAMLKMILDPMGGIVMTNDGYTIHSYNSVFDCYSHGDVVIALIVMPSYVKSMYLIQQQRT